jgi:hypothetical protein
MGRAAQLVNTTAAALQRLRQDGAGALLLPGGEAAAAPAASERLAESAGRGKHMYRKCTVRGKECRSFRLSCFCVWLW